MDLLFTGVYPYFATGAIHGAQAIWFDLSDMSLDAYSKNKHKHMSSKYKHSTRKSLLQAHSLELYIKEGTYAIEVHRALAWLQLLSWARTLTTQ